MKLTRISDDEIVNVAVNAPTAESFVDAFTNCYKAVAQAQLEADQKILDDYLKTLKKP